MPPRGHSSSSHSSSSRSHSGSSRSFSRSSSSRSYSSSNRSSWRSDRYSDSGGLFSSSNRSYRNSDDWNSSDNSDSEGFFFNSDRSYNDSDDWNSPGSGGDFTGVIAFVVIIIGILVLWGGVFFFRALKDNSNSGYVDDRVRVSENGDPGPSNVDIFGREIFLDKTGDSSYRIVTESDDFEKKLRWNEEYKSYYDQESDCYLWYNTDVEPNIWQYWYEGISSDFGDNGWMEYESDGWYIEESRSSWIKLPDSYDKSKLWHIESN